MSTANATTCDVAIIGAGPYGLSVAAHLKAHGVNFRIFGRPMETWQKHMPKGMHLKSEGFASSLSDPEGTFPLSVFCKQRGISYADMGIPVSLETFIAYAFEFQKKFVPEVENRLVETLKQDADGFSLRLEDGEVVSAQRVVIAVGLTHYEFAPPVLSTLPTELTSHSSAYSTVDRFNGQKVVVIGAGASALDLAAELNTAGASVELVCREPNVRIHDPPSGKPRTLFDRIRSPLSTIGTGWKSFLCTNAPLVFRQMPERFRLENVRRIAGPSGGWFIRDRVVGKVQFNVSVVVQKASVEGGRVRLDLADGNGSSRALFADHVIAATGYKVDVRRLAFMETALQNQIQTVEFAPKLSSNFESSVPGVYFVGTSGANTFGPLLRFVCGTEFTARRITKHLAARRGTRARAGKARLTETNSPRQRQLLDRN